MKPLVFLLFAFLIFSSPIHAQKQDKNLLLNILHDFPEQFDSILQNKEQYRLQIIYTQIDRDEKNRPHLTTYCLDTGKYYYYCASLIKLLEIPLAMEKINEVGRNFDLTIYDSLVVSGDPCGDPNDAAYKSPPGLCTPAQMIKEMFLVSNNLAFNPLYDFLTQAYFNRRAHELGYGSAVICNRFAACDTFQNRISSSVIFYDRSNGRIKYLQPATIDPVQPMVTGTNTVVGKGFLNVTDIGPPKDFAYYNYIAIADAHRLLIHLIFPGTQPKHQQIHLDPDDYTFLYKYMGMYPRESVLPVYDTVENHDVNLKFFITPTDTAGHAPGNIRVYNKAGQAYGFTTDCSYFTDTLNKIEFFLSCSIYTNKSDILNTGAYEYEMVAEPFLKNLCAAIYDYELNRNRKYLPVFEHRDFTDVPF